MKGAIKMYALLAYVLVFVATSAGAIQHGFDNAEHFYTAMGVLNLIVGAYASYKVWRSENPKE